MDKEGVDVTLLSDTLQSNRSHRNYYRQGQGFVPKKNHEPVCIREDHEHGVGPGVNTTLLSDGL